jgi:uncharacterized membrane protein YfcA
MDLVFIGIAALLTSGLTLFSGFGLGTILMPVFALFFPVPLAIAATAVVHLANNVFKFGLMARQADWRVVARFGFPAAIAALAGASLLTMFDRMPVVARYTWGGASFEVTAVKAVIGAVIIVFARAVAALSDAGPPAALASFRRRAVGILRWIVG